MADPTVEDLVNNLVRAKQAKKEADAAVLACENAILAKIAEKPEKGRVKLDGGLVKTTVEFKINYSADVDAILALSHGSVPLKRVPEHFAFDEKAYEALRTSNPDLFAKVAQHVTTKPAKPSFELKL